MPDKNIKNTKNTKNTKSKSKWKKKWEREWDEDLLELSETVIPLTSKPYLQQTQTYDDGTRIKYYRFSIPITYTEHGIINPKRTYKILIRKIIEKKSPAEDLTLIKEKWKRKWVKNWEEHKYVLDNAVHKLKKAPTIAQTKTTQDGEERVYWKITIPRDFTKYGLINPKKRYRLLFREILSEK